VRLFRAKAVKEVDAERDHATCVGDERTRRRRRRRRTRRAVVRFVLDDTVEGPRTPGRDSGVVSCI
jgi:hypothetical protein